MVGERRAAWGLAVALAGLVGCFSAPVYEGPARGNFDGEVFHNEPEVPAKGVDAFLRWRRMRDASPWVEVEGATTGAPPPQRVGAGELRVTFINHATLLVQMDGLNILTDPIWSQRASPVPWAGPARVRPPGLALEALPPIDVVLISHNHYDHLDVPTLQALERAHHPRFFAGLGNRALLVDEGMGQVTDMAWWDEVELGRGVRLVAVPAQHFSGRGLSDRNRTLWAGFVLEGAAGRVFFAGDTGFGPHFEQIAQRFAPFRLAMLPIGAYRPRYFMAPIHISPEEAVAAHQILKAHTSVGMHFGTFPLADDAQDEPVVELARALTEARVAPERFWVLDFGQGREVPRLPVSPTPGPEPEDQRPTAP